MTALKDDQHRIERDALGEYPMPADAYYGIHTARAADNFAISGYRFDRRLIVALGTLKWAAARANAELGLLEAGPAEAILAAADEVARGDWDDQFIVDVFQTGSGTSTNMNANEVIANRANELLGSERGSYAPVHPNDHVNLGQSSNDVIPTAIHLAVIHLASTRLVPALKGVDAALEEQAVRQHGILKTGRTHLMDATPIRLGQEFRGYAGQVALTCAALERALADLAEVPLGGTAVGTGVNTHRGFARAALRHVEARMGIALIETTNHFRSPSGIDQLVGASAALRGCALALAKIANDLRWMGSGPHAGLAEIALPELQPGSSIMPGKVNPVMPEVVVQVAARVVGNDVTVATAAQGGAFELNTMLPVTGHAILESVTLLAGAAEGLAARCIRDLVATDRGPRLVERSPALATPLARVLGYERAAAIAREAARRGAPIRDVAREMSGVPAEELDRLLDLERLTDG